MGLDCCCRDGYSGRRVFDETSDNPELVRAPIDSEALRDVRFDGHSDSSRTSREVRKVLNFRHWPDRCYRFATKQVFGNGARGQKRPSCNCRVFDSFE